MLPLPASFNTKGAVSSQLLISVLMCDLRSWFAWCWLLSAIQHWCHCCCQWHSIIDSFAASQPASRHHWAYQYEGIITGISILTGVRHHSIMVRIMILLVSHEIEETVRQLPLLWLWYVTYLDNQHNIFIVLSTMALASWHCCQHQHCASTNVMTLILALPEKSHCQSITTDCDVWPM